MTIHGSQGSIQRGRIGSLPVVFKTTKHNDICLQLEAKVLQIIHSECPELAEHFPKYIDLSNGQLVMTQIVGGIELAELIDSLKSRSATKIISNICFITLCVMETVRRKTGIVHNDLHVSNVMVKTTGTKSITFKFDEKTYTFATFGYFPVIIDFGYAYLPGNSIVPSLQNSDIGYTVEEPDLLADARLLLCTAFDGRMNKIINSIFGKLRLSKDGWFPHCMLTNPYDELYSIVGVKTCKNMDSVFTIVLNMMGDLKDESCISICGDTCYMAEDLVYAIVYSADENLDSDEEDDNSSSHNELLPLCECTMKVRAIYSELYTIRKLPVTDENRNLYEKAAIIFKPIIVRALARNRMIKASTYSKLSVANTLDVIDSCRRMLG